MKLVKHIRRPQYSLRSIIATLTVVVIASAAYWQGADRWRWRSEQRDFLSQAMMLKAGDEYPTWWSPVGHPSYSSFIQDWKGLRYYRYTVRRWPHVWYVVLLKCHKFHYASVEVFELPAPREGYAKRLSRKLVRERITSRSIGPREVSEDDYQDDFLEMIVGDRRDDADFDYRVLYSDP